MYDPLRWTSRLIHSLYENGVRHAVISPGSRSAPLTIAASIHPGVKKKVVLDERSAAFIALGIGKATGKPAILICTSGTAVANYYPAVIEARESGTPLIVLSADRPPNLRGIGSSQTIDQEKIFGNQAVFFHEAGEPVFEDQDLNRLEYLAKQAVEDAINKGGAAHINLPFRKPLEPTSEQLQSAIHSFKSSYEDKTRSSKPIKRTITFSDEISALINNSKKPLIIAGPANPHQSLSSQAEQLSRRLSAPVIAEPASGYPSDDFIIQRFYQILKNQKKNELNPDLIIRFGDQPFTKPLLSSLNTWKYVPVIHLISRDSRQDHALSVTHRILISPEDELELTGFDKKPGNKWLKTWMEKNQTAENKLNDTLENNEELTDGHVFYHLSKVLGDDWNIMLSNSFPVRDMAQFGYPSANQFVNRGAAGIDGIISTALGICESTNKPTCCFAGDLAFLHDSNSLYSMKTVEAPFLTVVINNGGGTIFRILPVFDLLNEEGKAGLFDTYFETPHDTDIRFLANASGISYHRVETVKELKNLDIQLFTGPTVIECITDAGKSMKLREVL